MAEMDEASYASAGSKVVISEAPRTGAMYICLAAGAFTGLPGMFVLLPPNRSQDDRSRATRHRRSGIKRLLCFFSLKSIRIFLLSGIHQQYIKTIVIQKRFYSIYLRVRE